MEPAPGFLQEVVDLAHSHGALAIFDETITGFRFANGGAQEFFGVTPDLATFGKGLANGYPVSAVAGKAEYMHGMEEIFFSFTFGGEALSLAASLATLEKLQREPVVENLRSCGQQLLNGLNRLIKKFNLEAILSTAGHLCNDEGGVTGSNNFILYEYAFQALSLPFLPIRSNQLPVYPNPLSKKLHIGFDL